MIAIATVLAFSIFLVLGFVIAFSSSPSRKKALINVMIVYLLLVHAALTVKERELWPFSNYRLLDGIAPVNHEDWLVEFDGVSSDGREWMIDPRAWSPVSDWAMQQWFIRFFRPLPDKERAEVLAFLLRRGEETRSALVSGQRAGNEKFLGAAAAPHWLLALRPAITPPEPFRKIRVYEIRFVSVERVTGQRSERRRELIAEYGP